MLDEFSRSKLLKKFGVCSQKNKKIKNLVCAIHRLKSMVYGF
jgi:hypothetical protein